RLCVFYAWALLLCGPLADVEPRLLDAEHLLATEHESATVLPELLGIRGHIAAIRARLARIHNDLPRSIALCHLALEYLPRDDLLLRDLITLNLGLAYWQSGDAASTLRVLSEAADVRAPSPTGLVALAILADREAELGHLHRAAEVYQRVFDRATAQGQP